MLSKLKKLFSAEKEKNEFPCLFTDKILKYSKELEWNIAIHSETHITVGFTFEDDRTQLVHIFDAGTVGDKAVIQVSSPAANLKDISDKMDQDFMNELLKLNSEAPNYCWAIENIEEDEDFLIASSDQLLETMDVGELSAATYAVAAAADKMEERFGLDSF